MFISVSRPSTILQLNVSLTVDLIRYNLRDYEDDIGVWEIAIARATAVTIGVLWALLASRIWWPSEARKELTKALGECVRNLSSSDQITNGPFRFCLNIGWLYTRLVASNSFAPEYHGGNEQNEGRAEGNALVRSSLQITRLHNSIHEFMAMCVSLFIPRPKYDAQTLSRELHLQIKLIELQNLLAQAQLEPRLKGPFPVKLYRDILTSLQTILDRLHSMRCVTTREEWYTVSYTVTLSHSSCRSL